MVDQAHKLRQAISSIRTKESSNPSENQSESSNKAARVITVTSGKGGVGKTNITVNLAVALSKMGLKVIVIDADFGLANIDVLLGIIPEFTLLDVIKGEKSILEVLCDGPQNIKFISGGSGVEELVRLDKNQLEKFVENIGLLDKLVDIILIDTGAGLSESVMSFVMAADEILLVTTPEPTSIMDAYALIKMVANRDKSKNIRIIANRVETPGEAEDIINKLCIVSYNFLSIKLNSLGYVLRDDMVIRAVKMQQPFLLKYPRCQAAKQIEDISKKIAGIAEYKTQKEDFGIKGFINRLIKFKTHSS
ncbi:MAG TPA: MinD/ParA family protein [Clostridiaceae bacterium]|nr:MinD/ParA family protein [Clostridiaceae bacterium]HHV99059.1 MinD/ParA family protein [Clostridiaceae bacterium]